ncbi:MAG: diacylglycerol kinase family protein [Leptothrix ochracea]|uniref:diacylglycerol/lipid kinase family protein n=1 Tax=Leptothrix ochracea TaxID=735331 RepID=UPI0034E1EE86
MSTNAIVMLNRHAGHGMASQLQTPIEAWLKRHAPGVPLLAPTSAHAALATLIILAPRTRVVLVGGDGTINTMLPAMLRRGHRLGLVPAGHTNSLAHALGLTGMTWQNALPFALNHPSAAIDVGQIDTGKGSWPFASRLSIGLDALMGLRAQMAPAFLRSSGMRRLWGVMHEWPRSKALPMRVWVDGKLAHEGDTLAVSVTNTPRVVATRGDRTEPITAAPPGTMDALILGKLGSLRGLSAMMRATPQPSPPKIISMRMHQIQIDSGTPLPLCADGEELPATGRLGIQVLPRSLQAVGQHAEAELWAPSTQS